MKYFHLRHLLLLGCATCAWSASAEDYSQLTDLPTLYIDTADSVPITSREDYLRATLRYVDAHGITLYDALGIRGRGNSTWFFDKKPYRLKFDKKQRLLGKTRANAKSWTLLANHADKTMIRNAVASRIGDFMGLPFTVAAQFADVVLNGEYRGCYQISDQVEVREKRVNITEQADSITDASDITGGYLLEVDGFATQEPVHFNTTRGVQITVKSPDDDVIAPRQLTYIQNHLNKFEDALFADNFTDSIEGYRPYVDAETLAGWYLASELTGNPDCFWSTYIYKERGDDKIYWGPLWDYDIAFNNCLNKGNDGDVTEYLMSDIAYGSDNLSSGDLSKLWVNRMWEDPWFRHLIHDRWQSLIASDFEARLLYSVDSLAAVVERGQQLNYTLWPIDQRTYVEVELYDNYADGVAYLKDYIHRRCAYLTQLLEQADQPITAFVPQEGCYRILNVQNHHSAQSVGDALVTCTPQPDDTTQLWRFLPADEGYYYIVNEATQQAVTDPSVLLSSGYDRGYQMALSPLDAARYAQQWQLKPLSRGRYIIVNRQSGLVWNNCGGSAQEQNVTISWNENRDHSYDFNNYWTLQWVAADALTAIQHLAAPADCRILYTPAEDALHLVARDGGTLCGTVTLYNLSGVVVAQLPAATEVSLAQLPRGSYLALWRMGDCMTLCRLCR